uniref:Bicarbonate transporter-like transmembrane domain-containing protein n=1 Tax=Phaeomonas parva TaxID=124430 RepID=A0A7S1U2B3_9STRA
MKLDLFRGIQDDFARRKPHYVNDWVDGWNLKTLAAILFIFCTSIGPAVTFAELLQSEVEVIGVVEVLLSTAISAGIFSIFAGQPLVIVGVTGPVSILTISIYGMAKALDINFIPFYAWAQIWAALMHMALAALNACDYIAYVTRFSCETFGILIATIYLYTGISGVVKYFNEDSFSAALLQLLITLGTVWLAERLSLAKNWSVFNETARDLIADYGATLALVFWAGVSFIGRAGDTDIPRVDTPSTFETTSGRDWFVDLGDIEGWAIVLAILPGIIITVLFIFDHNVSSLMAQDPELNLKKGAAYHLDFFVLGFCILATGILGIPPCNGLIPQAPLHTKALAVTRVTEKNGVKIHKVEKVYEQRFSNLAQALMTLLMCFPPFLDVIGFLPQASLNGLFIFMGLASFDGNQFFDRMMLMITEASQRVSSHDFFQEVSFPSIKKFTAFQLLCCAVIFGITLTPAAMVFPLLIAALVALRVYLLPKHFEDAELNSLDFLDVEGTLARLGGSGDAQAEHAPVPTEEVAANKGDIETEVELTRGA